MNYEKHLFICTRCTSPCGNEGDGELIQKDLKKYYKENHKDAKIRINKSGCLGQCKTGVNAVCYPDNKWFKNLDKNNVTDIKDYLSTKLAVYRND